MYRLSDRLSISLPPASFRPWICRPSTAAATHNAAEPRDVCSRASPHGRRMRAGGRRALSTLAASAVKAWQLLPVSGAHCGDPLWCTAAPVAAGNACRLW